MATLNDYELLVDGMGREFKAPRVPYKVIRVRTKRKPPTYRAQADRRPTYPIATCTICGRGFVYTSSLNETDITILTADRNAILKKPCDRHVI